MHIRSWVARVFAHYVPAPSRGVYPTWFFRLAPGGIVYCPSDKQDLNNGIDPALHTTGDLATGAAVLCPPSQQHHQMINLDLKDGLGGVLEFAWGINGIPSNNAGPVVPELVAVVMSACETGLVALLATPIVGAGRYEFCGFRRFRFYPAHDPEETHSWPGKEDGPLQSPFPKVDSDAFNGEEGESFTHHRIEFEWKEIILG